MTLRFRQLEVGPDAPVERWPTERVLAALERVVARARRDAEATERAEAAGRVQAHLDASGLGRAAFAEAFGTSSSRLSTYLSAKVAPSSTLLVRMERVARRGVSADDAPVDGRPGRRRS